MQIYFAVFRRGAPRVRSVFIPKIDLGAYTKYAPRVCIGCIFGFMLCGVGIYDGRSVHEVRPYV